MSDELASLVEQARGGDLDALEQLILSVQHRIYGLALRMLAVPEDAQDATQEILVKLVTGLASFRGESSFTTWAYRVAGNHLLNMRRRNTSRPERSFSQLEADLGTGLRYEPPDPRASIDDELLTEEIRLGCTLGILQCLDAEQRLAYILGEVIQVSGEEGGVILAITPAAFRQRLARARQRLRDFMARTCGLLDPANPCRCHKQVAPSIAAGRLNPAQLRFANHPRQPAVAADPDSAKAVMIGEAQAVLDRHEVMRLHEVGKIFRSHPSYAAPDSFASAIRQLIQSGQFRLLEQ